MFTTSTRPKSRLYKRRKTKKTFQKKTYQKKKYGGSLPDFGIQNAITQFFERYLKCVKK